MPNTVKLQAGQAFFVFDTSQIRQLNTGNPMSLYLQQILYTLTLV